MARQGRKVNGAELERLIDESSYSVAAFGREFARLRLKRKPTDEEASSARSQIQKIIRDDAGVGPRNLRLIASVLNVEPEAFLHKEPILVPAESQPAPIAIMQEALENQRVIRDRLEAIGEALANLEAGQTEILAALPAPKQARQKPAAAAPKRR